MAANLHISALLDLYGAILPEKQQRILDGYYNNDLSLSEIAENEGITRQGVSDFVKRSEAQLLEFEQKLGFYEKVVLLKNSAEDLNGGKGELTKLLEVIEQF